MMPNIEVVRPKDGVSSAPQETGLPKGSNPKFDQACFLGAATFLKAARIAGLTTVFFASESRTTVEPDRPHAPLAKSNTAGAFLR
jgi:hypothetical protein